MKIVKFEFSFFGVNTYIVYDPETKECAIIDPGTSAPEEEKVMFGFIEKNSLKVTQIIETHLHIDHVVGLSAARAKTDAPVAAHKADEFLGSRISAQATMFGIREKFDDVVIDRELHDGDVIHIGKGELKVLHVPGHSPGSVALYDEKDGFVITGDALFDMSIGRTDLPGGDYLTLVNAINDKLMKLPDSTVVYPGHGPATTIGRERAMNPYIK